MNKIFVSSPFKARGIWTREENVILAIKLCRAVSLRGFMPIAPHVYFPRFLDDELSEERAFAMRASKDLIKVCDELWFYEERGISEGMAFEMAEAEKLKKKVFSFTSLIQLDRVEDDENKFLELTEEFWKKESRTCRRSHK